MKLQDEEHYEKQPRAGLIPYIWDEDGELKFLMMISSDSKFGGAKPMISKGKIEIGETALEAAVREAKEELGFKVENIKGQFLKVFNGRQELYSGAYDLTIYGVHIKDKYDFNKWCYETLYIAWYNLETFKQVGRKDHIKFVEDLSRLITRT